jgi:peptidoglycan/xylan/chitin deacetylase (PgdA/CDA1 family)
MPRIVVCFPGGKHKVLTMSYDDGKFADRRLVQIFNQNGIKGTFHINSGLLHTEGRIPAEEIAELYQGHEVSAHTWTHPTIARCAKEQILHEVIEDRKQLERIVGYPVRGMSYPNGSHNPLLREMLPYMGIEYSRVVETTGGFGMPEDWLQWKATCHHNKNLMGLAEDFVNLHKTQYLYMMYVWGHSYEFDNDNNWDVMEKFCEYIGKREDIWYATNIEIVDYMKAFYALRFAASNEFVYNPSAQTVWLSVEGQIVEVPGGTQISLV